MSKSSAETSTQTSASLSRSTSVQTSKTTTADKQTTTDSKSVNDESPKRIQRSASWIQRKAEQDRKRTQWAYYGIAIGVAVLLFVNYVTFDLWMQARKEASLQLLDQERELRIEYEAKLRRLEETGSVPCVDDSSKCTDWAAEGACESQAVFMQWTCRKTCGSCQKAETIYLIGLYHAAPSAYEDWQQTVNDKFQYQEQTMS
jgi:ShK domain-like